MVSEVWMVRAQAEVLPEVEPLPFGHVRQVEHVGRRPCQHGDAPVPGDLHLPLAGGDAAAAGGHHQRPEAHGALGGGEAHDEQRVGEDDLEDVPFPHPLGVEAPAPQPGDDVPVIAGEEERLGVARGARAGLDPHRGEVALVVAEGRVEPEAVLEVALANDRELADVGGGADVPGLDAVRLPAVTVEPECGPRSAAPGRPGVLPGVPG